MYGYRMTGSWRPVWLLVAFMLLAACGEGDGTSLFGGSLTSYYPRFGFAANSGDKTLSVYLIDGLSGQWRPHGYVMTGAMPVAVTADLAGRYVFVANNTDGTVSAYTINASTGQLSPAGSAFTVGTTPAALTLDNAGKFLYVANGGSDDVSAFKVSSNGTVTLINCGIGAGCHGANFMADAAPAALAVDPSGKFLYVANSGTNNVSAYTIDPVTGALTNVGSPFTAGAGPRDLAVSPDGKFLYVVNHGSNDVSAFSIDAITGALATVSCGGLTGCNGDNYQAGTGAYSLCVDATGKYVYVANNTANTISGYTRDATTGALAGAGTTVSGDTDLRSLRADPSGLFIHTVSGTNRVTRAWRILAGGALSAQKVARTRATPAGLAITRASTTLAMAPLNAYVANYSSSTLERFQIDASTGAPNYAAYINSGTNPVDVAVDRFGRFAYVVNKSDDSLSAYTLAAGTGVMALAGGSIVTSTTQIGSPGTITLERATVDPSGRFVYVTGWLSNRVYAYSINTNGTLNAIANYATGTEPIGLTVDPTGQYLYVVNNNSFGAGSVSAYSIDPVTGALTSISTVSSVGTMPESVAIESSGQYLYVTNYSAGAGGSVQRYTITASSGALVSSASTTATLNGPGALAASPNGAYLYVANRSGPSASSFSISTSGALTSLGAVAVAGFTPAGIAVDPSGRYAYIANQGENTLGYYQLSQIGLLAYVSSLSGAMTAGPAAVAVTGLLQ